MKKRFFLLAIALQIFIGEIGLVAVVYPEGLEPFDEEKNTLCLYEILCIEDLGNFKTEEEENNYSFGGIYDDWMNPEFDVIEEKEERVRISNKKESDSLSKVGNGSTKDYIEEKTQSSTFYEIYTGTKKDVKLSNVCDRSGSSGEDSIDEKNSFCLFEILDR